MFYTLNQRPRQAPIQDSNSTLKPQLRANRESVAKHQQVNTPEQATHLRQLLATENRPSQELDYLNRKPLQERPPELEHWEVVTRRPTRRSRFRRRATQLLLTPDTEISRPQEREWILRRKKSTLHAGTLQSRRKAKRKRVKRRKVKRKRARKKKAKSMVPALTFQAVQ